MGADRVKQFRRKGELKLPLIPVVRNLVELRGYGFYVEILAPFRALQPRNTNRYTGHQAEPHSIANSAYTTAEKHGLPQHLL
jgi:hypothetical protein